MATNRVPRPAHRRVAPPGNTWGLLALDLKANHRSQTHFFMSSPGPTSDAGGLIFLLARRVFRDAPALVAIQAGRIAAVHAHFHDGTPITLCNVHKFDLTGCVVQTLGAMLRTSAGDSQTTWKCAGDWNLPEPQRTHDRRSAVGKECSGTSSNSPTADPPASARQLRDAALQWYTPPSTACM